jgi:FtsZ-interacting cell division protein ZipA
MIRFAVYVQGRLMKKTWIIILGLIMLAILIAIAFFASKSKGRAIVFDPTTAKETFRLECENYDYNAKGTDSQKQSLPQVPEFMRETANLNFTSQEICWNNCGQSPTQISIIESVNVILVDFNQEADISDDEKQLVKYVSSLNRDKNDQSLWVSEKRTLYYDIDSAQKLGEIIWREKCHFYR